MDYRKEIAALINYGALTPERVEPLITPTADAANGDFTLTCFSLAKEMRLAPHLIAAAVRDGLKPSPVIARAEAVGGYLNFFIDREFLVKNALDELVAAGEDIGASAVGAGKTVCIDYSSINIAKPFHIGHLSTTVIGGSLYRIFCKLGYKVVGINHLGDWGTQFGKLICAYLKWSDAADLKRGGIKRLLELYVRFHDEADKDESLNDEARGWFKKIEDGDAAALEIFHRFKEITLKEVGKTYDDLGVVFDSYNGESFYNDKLDEVTRLLSERGLLRQSDGAQIVDLEQYGMPPCLIRRSDGASLYATRDIAAAIYRKRTYDFDKCLYVVAYQQNLHFKQVFKVVELMGFDWAKDLIHVPFGMVSLEEGTLSTRKGKVVFLSDVLKKAVQKTRDVIESKNPELVNKEEVARRVGIGAVIYSALCGSRIKDVTFSYDRVLNFDGETGPYIQYTHARTASVLSRSQPGSKIDYKGISDDCATALIKLLIQYPSTVFAASDRLEPSLIAHLLIDVCKAFNKFYFENKILTDEEGVRNARLLLTKVTKNVLASGLNLLLMAAPDRM